MILEHAAITIRPDSAEGFEEAVRQGRSVIAAAHGFVSFQLHRGIEQPNRYVLLIQWETLDDHLVGFRGSAAFGEWRALVGPYFESPPVVDHLEAVAGLV
jgi:heme-degrading monooxygenase HmoA